MITKSFKPVRLLGSCRVFPLMADVNVVRGAMIVLNEGFAMEASKSPNLVCVGVSDVAVDNKNGNAGDQSVKVDRGIFVFNNDATSPVTRAHIGQDCYIFDNDTVTSDQTGSSVAGRVFDVDAHGVSIEFI